MHEVLVNRLGGLSLPRKSVVRLTDRPDMTLDVYRGRKTTTKQNKQTNLSFFYKCLLSTFKINKNAALFQWRIHGLWFKVLDRDNVPSCFQETIMNSTKYRSE